MFTNSTTNTDDKRKWGSSFCIIIRVTDDFVKVTKTYVNSSGWIVAMTQRIVGLNKNSKMRVVIGWMMNHRQKIQSTTLAIVNITEWTITITEQIIFMTQKIESMTEWILIITQKLIGVPLKIVLVWQRIIPIWQQIMGYTD